MRLTEAEEKYLEVIRKMSGEQRLKIGVELHEMAKEFVKASIREENPFLSDQELEERVKDRMK